MNSFISVLFNFFKEFIKAILDFWDILNYTFFTIPLDWLNDLLGLNKNSDFYFTNFNVNFLFVITSGLIVALLIHFIKFLTK